MRDTNILLSTSEKNALSKRQHGHNKNTVVVADSAKTASASLDVLSITTDAIAALELELPEEECDIEVLGTGP